MGQEPDPPVRGPGVPGVAESNRLEGLMRHREALELTDRQIARLEAIAGRLEQRNRPLLERLRVAGLPVDAEERSAVQDMTRRERMALRRAFQQERPTLRRLRANTRIAMEQVLRTLTPRQRMKARELLRDGPASGPTPGLAPDTAPRVPPGF